MVKKHNTKANSGIRRILKSLVQTSDANKDGKTEVKELEDFSDFDLVAWTWPGFLSSVKDDLKKGMRFCRFLIISQLLVLPLIMLSDAVLKNIINYRVSQKMSHSAFVVIAASAS